MTKFIEVTTTGDYDIFINVNNILDIAREKGTNNAIITLAASDNQEYYYIVPNYDEIIKQIKVLCSQLQQLKVLHFVTDWSPYYEY